MSFSSEKDKVFVVGYTLTSFIELNDGTYPKVIYQESVEVIVIIGTIKDSMFYPVALPYSFPDKINSHYSIVGICSSYLGKD